MAFRSGVFVGTEGRPAQRQIPPRRIGRRHKGLWLGAVGADQQGCHVVGVEMSPAPGLAQLLDGFRVASGPQHKISTRGPNHVLPSIAQAQDPQVLAVGLFVKRRASTAVDKDLQASVGSPIDEATPVVPVEDLALNVIGLDEIHRLHGETV